MNDAHNLYPVSIVSMPIMITTSAAAKPNTNKTTISAAKPNMNTTPGSA